MNSNFRSSVYALSVLLLGLCISTGALAARATKMDTFDNIPLQSASGKSLTLAQVKQAITSAAKSREWAVKDSGPSQITATILVRGEFRVTVDIPFTTKEFSIKYASSENLNYKESSKGPMIHPNYNKWVKNLSGDIRNAAMGL
jgi:hypothetical protein